MSTKPRSSAGGRSAERTVTFTLSVTLTGPWPTGPGEPLNERARQQLLAVCTDQAEFRKRCRVQSGKEGQ